jgi:ATP-binding cassette, subfamily G (WHITE), member 1
MPIIRREHFNRWYSIGAHYIALVISDLPILIACTLIFTGTVYIMTDHPIGDFRFPYLLSMAILMSFTSQAYGIFAGSIVELKLGLLFAALLLVYQIIFSGGLVFMKDVNPWWHWMFEISFMKHSLQGYTDVILGYNRENLECDDVYCHFATPAKFLKFIGLESNLPKVFYSMAFIGISLHFSAFLIMKIRLKFNL